MLYVFVFNNVTPSIRPNAYSVTADDLNEAVAKLVARLAPDRFYSPDPGDYHADIENGNLTVVLPTSLD